MTDLWQPLVLAKVIDAHKMDQALIFVRTRVDADNLVTFLDDLGGKEKGKKGAFGGPYCMFTLASNPNAITEFYSYD